MQKVDEKYPNLEDHIDDPIKKCVVGLSLLGFKTLFSCCGFEYAGEKVKKSHLTNKAYIYIQHSPELGDSKNAALLSLILNSGWSIGYVGPRAYELFYTGFGGGTDHPWAKSDAVHNFEGCVFAINHLEKEISKWVELDKDSISEVVIRDGNEIWSENHKYWQYQPCERWVVDYNTFINL